MNHLNDPALISAIQSIVSWRVLDNEDGVEIYETEQETYNGLPAVRIQGEDGTGMEFGAYLVIEGLDYL